MGTHTPCICIQVSLPIVYTLCIDIAYISIIYIISKYSVTDCWLCRQAKHKHCTCGRGFLVHILKKSTRVYLFIYLKKIQANASIHINCKDHYSRSHTLYMASLYSSLAQDKPAAVKVVDCRRWRRVNWSWWYDPQYPPISSHTGHWKLVYGW